MKTSTGSTESNIVNEVCESAPSYTGNLDPILLLEKLDAFNIQLLENPSDEDIQNIQRVLDSWVIITMEHEGQNMWIPSPPTIHKTTTRRPISERITHLIKSGGEWKCEHTQKNVIEVSYQQHVPFDIATTHQMKNDIHNGEINALMVALVHLHNVILNMLERGETSVGIFQKPDGIINMNRLRAWFDANEDICVWTMKHTLDIKTIQHAVNTATFNAPE